MRTYFFFAIMITGFFSIITAMVRPDIVQAKYEETVKPIEDYQKQKNQEAQRIATEQDHAEWMLKHQLPSDCYNTTKEVRKLECRSIKDNIERAFIRSRN